MTHLGYAKARWRGPQPHKSRNRTASKTVLTEIGPVEINVPRNCDSSCDPQTVRKNQRPLVEADSMVISLTAKSLTTCEVEAHLEEVYSSLDQRSGEA